MSDKLQNTANETKSNTDKHSKEEQHRAIVRNALGKRAYDTYGVEVGGLNYKGDPMPAWEQLTDKIQNAWIIQALDAYKQGAQMERFLNEMNRSLIEGQFTKEIKRKIGGEFTNGS